jgi:hypothetical protein
MSDTAPRQTNRLTGTLISDNQQHHLDAIEAAGEALYAAMHDAEGSAMPDGPIALRQHTYGSRRMAHAATLLETALMFARKAALQ